MESELIKNSSYSRIECIEDALNCISLHIYKKRYKECHWGEKANINSKNNNEYWILHNREELLKHSLLNS